LGSVRHFFPNYIQGGFRLLFDVLNSLVRCESLQGLC
jgi:hypothetical protein